LFTEKVRLPIMSLAKQEFTDVGRSMLGRAQNGETLTVSKIVVGSGVATNPNQLWPLTALIIHEMDVTISARRDYGQGTLLVEGSFLSNTAPQLFSLREVGIMAHIGTEADRLYSVANVIADTPDTIDPGSPSLQSFKIKLVIDRIPDTNLVIQIGPSENVIGQNLATDAIGPGIYKDAAGNVLNFKRLAAGSGIEIVEDPAETYLTIGAKVLGVDLDLYVPANHPNCPNPEVGFPSIQAAHDFLLQYRIPAGRVARINVWAGTFTQAKIDFNHVDSRQIQVLGWPRVTYNITRIDPISVSQKKITLDTTAHGLVAGQVVYIPIASTYYRGGCKILTAPAGTNYVTATIPLRGDRANTHPWGTADIANRTLRRYTTVVAFNDASQQICWGMPYGLGLIQNILVVNTAGTLGGYGIASSDSINMKDCQAFGPFRRGFSIGNGILQTGGETVVSECDFGVTGTGLIWLAASTPPDTAAFYANGCNTGIAPPAGGSAMAALVAGMPYVTAYLSHCSRGVECFGGGNFHGGTWFIDTCDIALSAVKGSTMWVGSGDNQSIYFYNNAIDLYAQGNAYLEYHYANSGTQNPICNPAANTPGNQEAYILVAA
jgi:hypothetical protein